MKKQIIRFLKFLFGALFLFLLLPGIGLAKNNIEFLDKERIKELNAGIYEVVTPKLESDTITYAKKLPFEKLDFQERNEKYYSIGTAFFINDKELMTAQHVFGLMYFSLNQDFFIRDSAGEVYPVRQIKKYSTLRDMVVFDLEKYPKKISPLALREEVEIGDTVFSAGNAHGEGIAYRAGQVASFTPEPEYGKWKNIRFSSPASPGNSGGPLLNLQGEVVGLIIQKTQSENYNVAVPVQEVGNLSGKADFHARNITVGIAGAEDSLVGTWTYSMDLPATVKEVADLAQTSMSNFWIALYRKLGEQVKEKNLPLGSRFRDYLRQQSKVMGFALLTPGPNYKKWRAVGYGNEKLVISADQKVIRRNLECADLSVVIEKESATGLHDFIDSPKRIMDTLLKAIPITRSVGTEDIRITSLGEPEKTVGWQDQLGRKWISSLWYLPYSDSFLYSHCLPYPRGALCNIDSDSNGRLTAGYLANIQDDYRELVMGYEGEIDDWVEFLSLGEQYLPDIFSQALIQRDNDTLQVSLGDFSLDITNPKINGTSNLHFHLGYAPEKLMTEKLLLFELFPTKGLSAHYRINPFFEPTPFNSDKFISTWEDIRNGTGDYGGSVVNRDGKKVIKKTLSKTITRGIAFPDQEFEQLYVAGCYYKASTETDVEQDCARFIEGIEFGVRGEE